MFVSFMIATWALPLIMANTLVSVAGDAYEMCAGNMHIIDIRIGMKIFMELEQIKRGWIILRTGCKKKKVGVRKYFFMAMYDEGIQGMGDFKTSKKPPNSKKSKVNK